MSDSDDPLAGADIGETVTVEHETEFGFWSGSGADPYVGFDRDHEDLSVESAEIVGERGSERVRITYSAEVTKEPEPYADSGDSGTSIERPSTWRYFKFPAAVTTVLAVLGAAVPDAAGSLVPLWLVLMVVWMAFSIVSGAYPWSMRMGGFR
jgi:hypothetical protein